MSHTVSEDLPSVKSELERKTVDLMETLVHRAETHRMSKADLSMVAKALWNITSGLVSGEVSSLCAAACMTDAPARMSRFFVGKGKALTVTWLPDGEGYAIITRDTTATGEYSVRPFKSEVGIRESELSKLFTTLVKSGYVELN